MSQDPVYFHKILCNLTGPCVISQDPVYFHRILCNLTGSCVISKDLAPPGWPPVTTGGRIGDIKHRAGFAKDDLVVKILNSLVLYCLAFSFSWNTCGQTENPYCSALNTARYTLHIFWTHIWNKGSSQTRSSQFSVALFYQNSRLPFWMSSYYLKRLFLT